MTEAPAQPESVYPELIEFLGLPAAGSLTLGEALQPRRVIP